MSINKRLNYVAQVQILGNSVLKAQRLQAQFKDWTRFKAKDPNQAPPLKSSRRLRELISRHYLAGQHAEGARKVAWVTSGGPVEFLLALGYYVLYPENHAAVCGIRRQVVDIAGEAEQAGYSRDICSYARTDIGAALSHKTPVGKLPRPDLLVCCNNICQTVLAWYRVLAEHFQVPLVVIDTPFIYNQAPDHALDYVRRQIEEAIVVAEKVAGKKLSHRRLSQVTQLSREASELWMQIMDFGRARPAPLTAFDQFIHMAPIVEMRGTQTAVDYYRSLHKELEQRCLNGIGAVRNERFRLIWDNLPIWFEMRHLAQFFAQHDAALVASTYTNAWGELAPMIDPQRPVESAAKVYLHPILNRGTGHKLQTLRRMAKDFSVDGVVLHSDRSCKPYSMGQIDQRERLASDSGIPALLLEADHNDPRAYAEEPGDNRISAFFELLERRVRS